MGFTRVEFLRILPAALRNYSYTQVDNRIEVLIQGKPLIITLGEEQVRRIAMLALPYILVTFNYAAVPEQAFKVFLQQFDLYYRKGGG